MTIVLYVMSIGVLVEGAVAMITPETFIRVLHRRTPAEFGKGPYPSVFDRMILKTQNPRNVRVLGLFLFIGGICFLVGLVATSR
jgi:hypothetical protein